MSQPKPARRWCFTLFETESDPINWPVTYICRGLETCPSTGKLHWQGYLELDKAKRLTQMKTLSKTAHWEVAKADVDANLKYCSKDMTDFKEVGNPKDYRAGQGARTDITALKALLDTGAKTLDVYEKMPEMYFRYERTIEKVISMIEPKRDWVTEVIVVAGPTGCGKTRRAIEAGAVPLEYAKNGGFIGGYNGEDVVLFDDYWPGDMPRGFWLRLTDRYPMQIPIKGGWRNWKPRTIYFTTNCDLGWWRDNPEVLRRSTLVDLWEASLTFNAICNI